MEIKGYKKIKSNLYEITFKDNTKIKLYDDIILKHNLLLTNVITKEELDKIIQDNSYLESYYEALKYLNTKLRTEKEIRKKLKDYSKEAVNYTIERLKGEKYLNDEVYIKAYVNDAINLKLMGPNKILYELKKLGFKESDILNYLNTFNAQVWNEKINNYIKKKINSNHNLSNYMLKQKIIKDLSNKGFYKEDILNYLNTFSTDTWRTKINNYIKKKINSNHNLSNYMLQQKIIKDLSNKGFYKEDILNILEEYSFPSENMIYEKEYEKLKNKYQKKYSGNDLENKIKATLYQKGFRK